VISPRKNMQMQPMAPWPLARQLRGDEGRCNQARVEQLVRQRASKLGAGRA
jgi:hypothetical protein